MAKKPKEPVVKPRCSGEWTEARFNSFVKSALRQATRRWAPIQHAKKDAWRARGLYECSGCNKIVPLTIPGEKKRLKNVIVDHINPLVPTVEGFTSWDDIATCFVRRITCKYFVSLVMMLRESKNERRERSTKIGLASPLSIILGGL